MPGWLASAGPSSSVRSSTVIPIDTRTALVGLHAPQCFLQVVSLTHLLHQSVGSSGAFGSTGRPGRFSLSPASLSSFTRQLDREVQLRLDMPLRVVRETHGLLTTPPRSGLQSSFPARPICCSAFRRWSASRALPTSGPTTPSADFCAAVRPPPDGLSRPTATRRRSPGVSAAAFRAQSPDLRVAPLMDMAFAVSRPLGRRARLLSGSCPSTRTFAPCFFQTPPRGGGPCIIARPSPPSGWPKDFHLQAAAHAQHTTKPLARRTLRVRRARASRVAWGSQEVSCDPLSPHHAGGAPAPELRPHHDLDVSPRGRAVRPPLQVPA